MAFSSFDDLCDSYGDFSSPSPFRLSSGRMSLPHQGALCRLEGQEETMYILAIQLEDGSTHELQFLRKDFDFSLRLFAIMDSDSRGQVSKHTVKEFVTLRCPVFWRRDGDLQRKLDRGASPTFEEVWRAVSTCSINPQIDDDDDLESIEIGVEAWMVFCRFIALAQYLEAKRRFSGRHLQQTMRHRNAPRGSEVVVVDVPPAAPPVPLTAAELAQYERESSRCLPLPELDLDHSLLAAHDILRRRRKEFNGGRAKVKIDLFGSSNSLLTHASSPHAVEFCLTNYKEMEEDCDCVTVRRSMKDMQWLHETLISHKALGGTLCGRILPPFPGKILSSQLYNDDSSLGSTGDVLAAAANAGVGILKAGIKSLWGSYSTPNPEPKSIAERTAASKKASNVSLPESYYNPNSPACKARQLERYINYLLEHPALSTSFPLNTILKASQSGLEAAKQSLEEHTRTSKEINEQISTIDDGKLANFWPLQASGSQQPNLSWVRTAAQAAVALQLHGVLETSGLPSASARLQHASLPIYDNSCSSAWNSDDGEMPTRNDSDATPEDDAEDSFEEGVLHVQDELESESIEDDGNIGYDLLPLPVPAPERRILTVSDKRPTSPHGSVTRFRYGSPTMQEQLLAVDIDEGKPAYIGEMAVDENIDKLREVIGSVDNTLSRCMASSGGIGKARRQRHALHLQVVRGLDSWEGLRGKFVSQRALLKGVSGIEQSREVFEESDLALIDDVSWQTALANSAVSAAEDVRSTVRAARTATNAKATATKAAVTAQKACETGKFSSIDDARAAQTRASIAQSHAIHSAVVEHEAKTVKRRATLALAHDVKCWNAHRKREILRTVVSYAKSQHEATRRAVDAWSCLRDGYVGSTIIPSTQTRRQSTPKPSLESFNDDVQTMIYSDKDDDSGERPTIVAVEHELLGRDFGCNGSGGGEIISPAEPETILPLVLASPIPEGDEDAASSRGLEDFGRSSHSQSPVVTVSSHSGGTSTHSQAHSQNLSVSKSPTKSVVASEENEVLTSSMQSLVDGLMNWGGQYDDEEDFALPTGMAASIALEESGVLGGQKNI